MKEPGHNSTLHVVARVLVIFSLLILMFVGGMFVAEKFFVDDEPVESTPSRVINKPEEVEMSEEVVPEEDEEEEEMDVDDEPSEFLTIDWYADARQIEGSAPAYFELLKDSRAIFEPARIYELGVVRGGEYEGYRLRHELVEVGGMGTTYETIYYLVPDSAVAPIVYLDQETRSYTFSGSYYPGSPTSYAKVLRENLGWEIDYVSAVQDVARTTPRLANGVELDFVDESPPVHSPWATDLYPRTEDPSYPLSGGGVAYLALLPGGQFVANANLLYIVGEDGHVYWYSVKSPFDIERLSANFTLTLQNPSIELGAYTTGTPGGCGYGTLYSVTADAVEIASLQSFGVSKEGVQLYKPNTYDQLVYRSAFELWLHWNAEGTFADFEADYPFLYYKDALGRWVKLMSNEVISGAECGKPVIYLYPEETQDMTVWVDPVGGFTKVEPDYNDGWRVTANPDGRLMNRDDGSYYPYLFWEGRGGAYAEPSKYWVVSQEELDTFLPETLLKLGLNKAEAGDFLEFWRPLMKDAPYYKIGFWGNDVMDALAPLKISQDPDVVVRILMDYTPLDAPIAENPPVLPETPERTGFTVIEWGGVFR